jgi:hypothetical protein
MVNLILGGKTFEDGVEEAGLPDTEVFRQFWSEVAADLAEDTAAEKRGEAGPANWIDWDATD